jgi:hypothetical protein
VAELVRQQVDRRLAREHDLVAEGRSEEAAVCIRELVDDRVVARGVEAGAGRLCPRRLED